MVAHCQVTGQLALRLGLNERIAGGLTQTFARWDGRGSPDSLRGTDIDIAIRLVQLADIVEVHHRRGGVAGALDAARRRSGTTLDPAVVAEFSTSGRDLLENLPAESSWDDLIAANPTPRGLTDLEVDQALEAMADFVDLKSPFFAGHSRGVADLAEAAAQRQAHSPADVRTLRRAGLVHDLGRSGVPNTIWDKPGALTRLERDRMELHSYYTDRMLRHMPALSDVHGVAALAHERLDGSGYHRGLAGTAIPALARLLAAADSYHAMVEARPHRPARTAESAAAELRSEYRAGRLDGSAVEAVLGAAGHRTYDPGRWRASRAHPAGGRGPGAAGPGGVHPLDRSRVGDHAEDRR